MKEKRKRTMNGSQARSQTEQNLSLLYRKINRFSDLFWGVDKDLDELQNKKRRTSLNSYSSFERGAPKPVSSVPGTVSLGYGELRMNQFGKILAYMMDDLRDGSKLSNSSSFLDIGSGYGKCVMHAKLQSGAAKCDGIEYSEKRCDCSNRVLKGLEDTMDLKGVDLIKADATSFDSFDYTHVYMFDPVFTEETHGELFERLERSETVKVLVCYCRPEKAKRLGLESFVQVHKMSVKSTGGESFTVRFYVKDK